MATKTAIKKQDTVAKAAAATKTATPDEAVKAEPVNVKADPVKKAAVKKVPVKKTAAKAEPAKKAAVKAAPEKKEAVKKTTAAKQTEAKRTAARKPAAKKEIKVNAVVEYYGKQVEEKDMIAAVKKAWTRTGKKVGDIKTMDLYIKPEEGAVYYVINGDATGAVAF